MHFIIRSCLAGVVLIIGDELLTPHCLVSGATTLETANHHLRSSERQGNAGHQHVAHLDENTKANKKYLRLLANKMTSPIPSDPPTVSDQPSASVQPSVSIQPSIEPAGSIQPSITDLCSLGKNHFCHNDVIWLCFGSPF
jgi:hypothetical protein